MVLTKINKFVQMIDLGHTLFGLPFAYLGAFLAIQGMPTAHQLIWITVAMVSARTAALCLNRLIDRRIDRLNPRTSNWVLAKEELNPQIIWGLVFVFFAILLYSAWQLNMLCVKLAPLAVIVLWVYSYTKRFTWWCHLFLGIAIGIGPAGAWIAVTGTLDWQPFILSLAVACWIAGFDTMYACQDIEFDRKHNLHSIPARFGEKGALIFSSVFHVFTVIFLVLTGLVLNLGFTYYLGVAFATVILLYQHIIVTPGNLDRVNFASFKVNRYVGLIIFILTIIDIF
ncbi:Menaquinone via futalosine polyprenyltransferase [Candidatus Syntrophocurvum alkaliphilum]|uniref:4-hydroxybenzoate polyprenyltransferase n=1 Tax=Candidatus Syntrophocurvum alkaliphilum TaxID=2293317 RepID=A0A6I6DC98_9FIRM|nr:4-hydroxybenzoate octaprenyltransferase [Candidatus Syntrophocurvum alkaliphilum]QGT99044.1 Menaquinone via futalosine polyprenyltransferase [Candidatus Syntrophocurvum alkaliphilum]